MKPLLISCLFLIAAACSRTPPPEPETVVLSVKGMTCQNCVDGITGTLSRLPPVSEIEVDLESERARIVYRPDEITPEQLAERISRLGFTASVAAADDTVQP